MAYAVERVTTEEEMAKVDQFIQDHFVPDMPLIRAFGLDNSPPPPPPSNSNAKPPRQADDIYIKAVDSQGATIGVAFNRFNPTFTVTAESSTAFKQMVEFMDFVAEAAQLKKLPERTIELRALSVRDDWRQRGVAKRLAEESQKAAREAGWQAMRVCCTSEFTAKLVRSMGWREVYRLAYKDYPTLSGREVYLKPTPPHDHLYYYVTDFRGN